MPDLTAIVQESCAFEFYRDGSLWYKTDSGYQFPVPVEDTKGGTFLAHYPRAITLMRWIRKNLALKEATSA